MKRIAKQHGDSFHLLRRQFGPPRSHALAQFGCFAAVFVTLQFERGQALAEVRIVRLHQPLLDKLQKSRQGSLRIAMGGPQLGELVLEYIRTVARGIEIGLKQVPEPVGLQDLPGDNIDDDLIKLVHGHPQPRAGHRPFLQFRRTAIIAIAPTLAGVDDQRRAAVPATCDASEQGRSIGDPGRHAPGIAALQPGLDLIEQPFLDDRRHLDADPLGRRMGLLVAAVEAVEDVAAMISGHGQDAVDTSGRKYLATPGDSPLVQMNGDCLDTDDRAIPTRGHVEDAAHDSRLILVDHQDLLVLGATPFPNLEAVAKGRFGAIPEPLASILAHGAVHMLGVLA
ncbi:MAG: hypothetical protein QM672_06455 [Labrys sp. (in: a-proteobacteria)]